MRHVVLALFLLVFTTITTHAQCDKKVTWHASKAEIIGADSQVLKTKEGTITITTTKTNINIEIVEDPGGTLTGVVRETACTWQEAFKNGKTVYKVDMARQTGETSDASVTVEAKDGKISILVIIGKMEGRMIRVWVDKYEEEGSAK
jgi:hypothetical protein